MIDYICCFGAQGSLGLSGYQEQDDLQGTTIETVSVCEMGVTF
jgi:hypothetical protein